MLVKLSRNSWHSRYYKWVKGYYPTDEFKSVCPYFWTIVSFLGLFPLIALWKGFNFIFKILIEKPLEGAIERSFERKLNQKKKESSKFSKWFDKNGDTLGKWVGYIWFGFMGLILLFWIVIQFIESTKKFGIWVTLVYVLAIIGGLTVSILIGAGINSFRESDTWSMIKGMLYSIKNKACPMIKWDVPTKPKFENLDDDTFL